MTRAHQARTTNSFSFFATFASPLRPLRLSKIYLTAKDAKVFAKVAKKIRLIFFTVARTREMF